MYLDEVRKGITTIQMSTFAEMLNETATNIIGDWTPMTESEKNIIVANLQKHRYSL